MAPARAASAAAVCVGLTALLACGSAETPDGASVASAPGGPGVSVHGAFATAPVGVDAAVYLMLRDESGAGDRLVAVHSPDAAHAMLHQTTQREGRVRMSALAGGVPLAPGGSALLAPGGAHVMLHGLARSLAVGERVTLELELERAGRVRVEAPVVGLADVEARAEALHAAHVVAP